MRKERRRSCCCCLKRKKEQAQPLEEEKAKDELQLGTKTGQGGVKKSWESG